MPVFRLLLPPMSWLICVALLSGFFFMYLVVYSHTTAVNLRLFPTSQNLYRNLKAGRIEDQRRTMPLTKKISSLSSISTNTSHNTFNSLHENVVPNNGTRVLNEVFTENSRTNNNKMTLVGKDAHLNASQDGDVCFKSKCWGEPVTSIRCFRNGAIPGAMIYYLRKKIIFKHEEGGDHHQFRPGSQLFKNHLLNLPADDNYCRIFRNLSDYSRPRDFGDFLDAIVISYITHHRDQKITAIKDGSISISVMFDFGLAFCPHYTILLAAPIYQCCLIRRTTYERLTELKTSLPSLFQEQTRDDPLYPLLKPVQIMKVVKRIRMLLSLTDYCIELKGYENVVKDFL